MRSYIYSKIVVFIVKVIKMKVMRLTRNIFVLTVILLIAPTFSFVPEIGFFVAKMQAEDLRNIATDDKGHKIIHNLSLLPVEHPFLTENKYEQYVFKTVIKGNEPEILLKIDYNILKAFYDKSIVVKRNKPDQILFNDNLLPSNEDILREELTNCILDPYYKQELFDEYYSSCNVILEEIELTTLWQYIRAYYRFKVKDRISVPDIQWKTKRQMRRVRMWPHLLFGIKSMLKIK